MISLNRITDISKSNFLYKKFDLEISEIQISDISN